MESDIGRRLNQFIAYKRLSRRRFQASVGVSNSYIQNISKGISADVMNKITSTYSDLNSDWLLTGEGEMLKPQPPSQTSHGDNSPNIAGNGNHVNPNAYDALLKIVESYQASTHKFQEQIDRLITIIEGRK